MFIKAYFGYLNIICIINYNMSIEVEILDDKKVEDIIYFAKKGDTLLGVAEKFCIRLEDLLLDNDLLKNSVIEEGDILWVRKRNMALHIVKPLDTFESLSKKYNVTISHIKDVNNITTLFIGQKIII
ncbi:MAG: LysM peptidoglycan-binding domain-containing protein [Clostridia bacterium]|nr:LysM peptidoglycan-binding domain-containing protein [Clostridia bacterium]